jgi:DNA-binding CsgD family transcriptional regulator
VDEAFQGGQRLSLDDAVAYALRGNGGGERAPTGWASLTRTEEAVVAEVRLGHTNRQISDALLMRPDTVKTHLSHMYAKLGVANRTELASAAQLHASTMT